METADAVVIGGGVIGASIAYRLTEVVDNIVLIDKGEIGGQTSGSCDKAIFLQSKKPGYPIKLAKASRDIYEDLEEELGVPFEFKQAGGMVVIENEAHVPFMKEFVENQNKAGIQVQLLDRKEALFAQACFSQHIVGATYCNADAEVNPLLLSNAFAKAAKRKGVQIRTHTEVTNVLTEKGKVTGVETTQGKIATRYVINAAGPFAVNIARMANITLPIQPRRGVILISERTRPIVNGNVLCSQYIAAKHLSSSERAVPPYGIGLSLGQTDSGNLLIGGSREFVGFEKKVAPDVFAKIAAHAIRIAPALESIRIIRTMTGFRPFTGDGLPIIDEVENVKGFIIAAGHEGDGIALAPITGVLVADLVAKKENDLLLPLKLNRFDHRPHK
ncbi:NAD(P)/FAD-dependent oxidoreductase [Virgibacillus sp. W0430]|uniref:NAD(P)/FAD-dependent oxidoreductase n=1 Tax=Virgibacillus sp. W0430 TaxID=3391580 RepID=UPI003F48CCE0